MLNEIMTFILGAIAFLVGFFVKMKISRASSAPFKTILDKNTEVEIGGDKSDFKPTIKLKKWGEECFLKLSLPTNKKIGAIQEDEKVKWKDDKKEVHFYQTKHKIEERSGQSLSSKDSYDVEIKKEKGVDALFVEGSLATLESEHEIADMKKDAELAFGDVLIGGLGLGIIQKILLENPKVKSITTIEISQEVIDLIKERSPELFNEKHKVIKDNFRSFCKETELKFDYIYDDTWSSCPNINDWNELVELAEPIKKDGGIIHCWRKENALLPLKEEELDAFEFDVVLKEKPDSNKIILDLETKGLKFYYQPELTEEEKKTSFRPENVIGSYAVYHKTQDKGVKTKAEGKKYRVGKAFHIYRPRIKDSAGKEVWGKLNIDEKARKLIVEIPQEFLDSAVYPIYQAAGALIGYDTGGSSSYQIGGTSGSQIVGSLFTGVATEITGMSACISKLVAGTGGTTWGAMVGIYKESDDYLLTNGVAIKRTDDFVDKAFYDFTFTSNPTMTAVDYYLSALGIFSQPTRGNAWGTTIYYDAGDANQGERFPNYSPTDEFDDPATWAFSSTNKYSIYASYAGVSYRRRVMISGFSKIKNIIIAALIGGFILGLIALNSCKYYVWHKGEKECISEEIKEYIENVESGNINRLKSERGIFSQ